MLGRDQKIVAMAPSHSEFQNIPGKKRPLSHQILVCGSHGNHSHRLPLREVLAELELRSTEVCEFQTPWPVIEWMLAMSVAEQWESESQNFSLSIPAMDPSSLMPGCIGQSGSPRERQRSQGTIECEDYEVPRSPAPTALYRVVVAQGRIPTRNVQGIDSADEHRIPTEGRHGPNPRASVQFDRKPHTEVPLFWKCLRCLCHPGCSSWAVTEPSDCQLHTEWFQCFELQRRAHGSSDPTKRRTAASRTHPKPPADMAVLPGDDQSHGF